MTVDVAWIKEEKNEIEIQFSLKDSKRANFVC